MLKILAGEARGRPLKTPPKSAPTRPILARIKKSLFDILRPRMAGCHFLDLYAGSGAVGLEAISQGAHQAMLVEDNPICFRLIQENIKLLRYESKAQVYRLNVLEDLSLLPKPFDLIFMGPPYKDTAKNMLSLTQPTLLNIEKFGLLGPSGVVIAQHHQKEETTAPSPYWEKFRQEKYGDSILSFYKGKDG